MDFLSEFGKRFTNAARSVVSDKGKDGGEAARLADELRAASAELEQLFAAYGRICYAGHDGDATADLAARIRAGMTRVEALSARWEDWQGGRRCAACGASQPKSAHFCANCGKRLADAPSEPVPENAPEGFCPRCGAALAPGEPYCPVCGGDAAAQDAVPAVDAAPKPAPDAGMLAAIDPEEPAPEDAE